MPKSRNRSKKKKKLKGNTRHIPSMVSQNIMKRHFFECAWCCTNLTERHHIEEFNTGGLHTEENLILLCPNCHRRVHKGQINKQDLILRKSTHLKMDRLSGNFSISLEKLQFKLGTNTFTNVRHIMAYKTQPILTFFRENEKTFVNATFYSKSGDVIFWMRNNFFWTASEYKVNSSMDFLSIVDTKRKEDILKLERKDASIVISCNTFLGNNPFIINESVFKESNFELKNSVVENHHIGYWHSGAKLTAQQFLDANNEKYPNLTSSFIFDNNKFIKIENSYFH